MAASFQQDAPPGKTKGGNFSPHRNKSSLSYFFINSKTQKRNFG
jgi:hypothetical protein